MAVSAKRRAPPSDGFSPSPSPPPPSARPVKKAHRVANKFVQVFGEPSDPKSGPDEPAPLPTRPHGPSYHRPLLFDRPDTILAFLQWFSKVSSKRDMPWRAPFIDPSDYTDAAAELRQARKKRAYQVWISEIMLQQTRVETVKTYWLNWMTKWPTIEDLAAADEDAVLAAWRGLGYYSRATRIHTAAKQVVADPQMNGLLPETPEELEKNVPGVGPYTAGAISSIVFGHAVPIIDGNVNRVLSRQLGLYANPKLKQTSDFMWAAAQRLVKKAYEVGEEKGNVPGEWNQALMELGSTVCTPTKPGCGECPIRPTCRAYHEAEAEAAKHKGKQKTAAIPDIEDLCTYCEPFPFIEEESINVQDDRSKPKAINKLRQATLSFGFASPTPKSKTPESAGTTAQYEKHICKFPMKLEKKKIRQEECLVCIIQRSNGDFLLEQRPSTGLLASMWQFPSLTLSTTAAASSSSDQPVPVHVDKPIPNLINPFLGSLLDAKPSVESRDNLGSITHIFSHLHLTMHVYKVVLQDDSNAVLTTTKKNSKQQQDSAATSEKNKNFGSKLGDNAVRRWADADEVEAETMGTGMRNCWLALRSRDEQPSIKTKGGRMKR